MGKVTVNLLQMVYIFIFVEIEISSNVIPGIQICGCIGFEIFKNFCSIVVPQNLVFYWFLLISDKHKKLIQNVMICKMVQIIVWFTSTKNQAEKPHHGGVMYFRFDFASARYQ